MCVSIHGQCDTFVFLYMDRVLMLNDTCVSIHGQSDTCVFLYMDRVIHVCLYILCTKRNAYF